MIVRFTSITILKWIVSYFAVGLVATYLIPGNTPLIVKDILIWIVTSILALVFAEWAFKTKLPEKKDVIELFIIWFLVTCAMSLAFDILLYGEPIFLLKAWDIKVQYALELVMVLVAAYLARKRRLAKAGGEGLSA